MARGVGMGRGGVRAARGRPRGACADPVRAGGEAGGPGRAADPCAGHRRRDRAPRSTGRRPGRSQLLRCACRPGGGARRRPAGPGGVRRRERAGRRDVVPGRLPERPHQEDARRERRGLASPGPRRLRGTGPHGRADHAHRHRRDGAPGCLTHRTGRPGPPVGRPPGHLRQVPARRRRVDAPVDELVGSGRGELVRMDTGHWPMFSQPRELARVLGSRPPDPPEPAPAGHADPSPRRDAVAVVHAR